MSPDLADVARRAQSHADRQEHEAARALLDEALSHPEVHRAASWPTPFEKLVAQYGLGVMHVLYDDFGKAEVVRAFLAEVVRVVRPEVTGEWVKAKVTPNPHPALGSDPQLADTEYTLGPATFVHSVMGEAGPRDPRDGYGYELAFTLRVPGGDGLVRTARLVTSSWTLDPRPVHFELTRFTSAELRGVREAGARHFQGDRSDFETWAFRNATEALREGERGEALRLISASLATPRDRVVQRRPLRQLLWLRAQLEELSSAREQAEAEALRAEPRLDTLAALASGARTLPGWTQALARRVLALLTPWEPASVAELGDPARAWTSHPLWGGVGAEGWQRLSRQRTARGPQGSTPVEVLEPVGFEAATAALRRALSLANLDPLEFGKRSPHDAEVTLVDGGEATVRAVVQRRVERPDGTACWWTWLWRGVGPEGAVVMTQLPRERELHPNTVALRTELAWLGPRGDAEARLLKDSPTFRLAPAEGAP